MSEWTTTKPSSKKDAGYYYVRTLAFRGGVTNTVGDGPERKQTIVLAGHDCYRFSVVRVDWDNEERALLVFMLGVENPILASDPHSVLTSWEWQRTTLPIDPCGECDKAAETRTALRLEKEAAQKAMQAIRNAERNASLARGSS